MPITSSCTKHRVDTLAQSFFKTPQGFCFVGVALSRKSFGPTKSEKGHLNSLARLSNSSIEEDLLLEGETAFVARWNM